MRHGKSQHPHVFCTWFVCVSERGGFSCAEVFSASFPSVLSVGKLAVCKELMEGQWRIVAMKVTSILVERQVASSWC